MRATARRARLARPAPRRPAQDDAGVTLVELLVSMSVFTLLLALVMTAVVSMSRSAVKVGNTADASDSLRLAFETMDRQVRYADAVNAPSSDATSTSVVFRVSAQAPGTPPQCTQWRLRGAVGAAGAVLETRTWADGATPGTTWRTVAGRLVRTDAPAPFTLPAPAPGDLHQSIGVRLTASRGSGATQATASVGTVFIARNTPSTPSASTACPGAN